MATTFASDPSPQHPTNWRGDQAFFLRFAIFMLLLVLVAFAQWSLRGFVDFGAVPVWVHFHGVVMLSWFGLFVGQNLLAARGNLTLHRRLGWFGLILLAVLIPLGMFTIIKAIELHRVPPFFTNSYFLALGWVGWPFVVALVTTAIAKRRQTEWHRRLMLCAFILLLEPAFGRLLPMPQLGSAAAWVEMLCQYAVLGIAMAHDRRLHGRVHPALWWGAAALLAMYVGIHLLSTFPPWVAMAEAIAAR